MSKIFVPEGFLLSQIPDLGILCFPHRFGRQKGEKPFGAARCHDSSHDTALGVALHLVSQTLFLLQNRVVWGATLIFWGLIPKARFLPPLKQMLCCYGKPFA